jgi:hypothetical protein
VAAAVLPRSGPRPSPERLLSLAKAGDPQAQHNIAVAYAEGRGGRKDFERAGEWFREAAINGVVNAQYNLAVLHERGLGVRRDPIEALIWYHSAADAGHAAAQFNLGVLYLGEGGIPRSDADAARWFRAAAERGMPRAQYMMGLMAERGQGVALSIREALNWYRLAAAAGDRDAERRLAALQSPGELQRLASLGPTEPALFLQESSPDSEPVVLSDEETSPTSLQNAALAEGGPIPVGLAPTAPESPLDSDRASERLTRTMLVEMQRLLTQAGFDTGTLDGRLGERTTDAIRRYQQKIGMTVDGSASPALLTILRARSAPPPPAARR